MAWITDRAANDPSVFTITERAPTRCEIGIGLLDADAKVIRDRRVG